MAVKDFLTISRAKIQLTSLPTAALGLTLGSTALRDLIQPEAFIYVLLFHNLLAFACGLNCACDLAVDEKYKRSLSDAVRALGAVKIRRILGFEVILSLAMIVWLAALKGNAFLSWLRSGSSRESPIRCLRSGSRNGGRSASSRSWEAFTSCLSPAAGS